jgi:hypothetical protein
MKPSMGKTRHGKPFLEYRCKPDKAGGRCPAPASVKSTVVEPFVVSKLFEFADGATARSEATAEDPTLDVEIAEAEAERDAALDERLAAALGGPQSEAYLRTVGSRQSRVDELLERRAERERNREPGELDIDLKEIWDELELEERRRILHSVFDSAFVWRTSDKGRNGKAPIAERCRLFLAGEGPSVPTRGQRGTIRTLPLD